jgi:glycosyltransferase involved in cell wall biosynthesis
MQIKKTIIYTGGFELPDKNAAAQRVLANAKIFRELGFNVVLIGIDKTLPPYNHIKDTKSSVQGFESWSIPYPANKKSWLKHITSNEHIEYLVEHYYKEDLYGVICYNYPAIALYKVKKMCSKQNILFIPDATEWYESNGGGTLFNTIKWLDTSMRMRFIHPKADGVISTSKYLTNFYKKRNCLTVELPTLYDVKSFPHINPTEIQSDIIKLMYAGSAFNLDRIDKDRTTIKDRLDKIIVMLHNVYQQQANFTFDIYGLTQENYVSVFPEHTSILDELSNIITFHGRKPHAEIVDTIQQSDFTIFLRDIVRVIEAGFPSKFSESISYGTPVISNMISNIEDYAVEGKNSYIIGLEDEKKQVKKMIQILNLNREERQSMKRYCLKNKIFDYREYINSVEIFLQKIENNL